MKIETADHKREIILLHAEINKLNQSIASQKRYNEWLRDQLMLAETAIRKKDYIIMEGETKIADLRKQLEDLLRKSTQKQTKKTGTVCCDRCQANENAQEPDLQVRTGRGDSKCF